MRLNIKDMWNRGGISDVTAPAHTRVWFAVYTGSKSPTRLEEPVALIGVKSVKPFNVLYEVRTRDFHCFIILLYRDRYLLENYKEVDFKQYSSQKHACGIGNLIVSLFLRTF